LADALDSKSCGSNTVRVRPPLSAPRDEMPVFSTNTGIFYLRKNKNSRCEKA
jgi:hypothetical protein